MNNATLNALLSSASNEWGTPSIYVEAARLVMGGIDLDPASCEKANRTVQAIRYFTEAQNGLAHSWRTATGTPSRVWCNPPYGTHRNKSNQGIWIRRLIHDYEAGDIAQAIILSNAATDTRWFHQLFAYPICFTEGRINYFSLTHHTDTAMSRPEKSQNTHGSAFTYLGTRQSQFIDVFSQFGTIICRVSAAPSAQSLTDELWKCGGAA